MSRGFVIMGAQRALYYTIAWFDDPADARDAIFALDIVPRRHGAIYDLAILQRSLQVGRCKVPPTHAQAKLGGEGAKQTKRGGSHRGTKGLVIIDSWDHAASLNAETRFLSTVPLPLIYPRPTNEFPSFGQF